MAERESQFITVSRQGILVATAVGVGLLTFSYVIGVQVGKRSLTQKSSKAFSIDEELKKLPVPLDEQIDIFKSMDGGGGRRTERQSQSAATPVTTEAQKREPEPTKQQSEPIRQPQTEPTKQQIEPVRQPVAQVVPAQTAPPRSAVLQIAQGERWTAQIAAFNNSDSANRLLETLKQEGTPAKVAFTNGLYKVQLEWSGTRAELDPIISRLQARGHAPMAVRLQ